LAAERRVELNADSLGLSCRRASHRKHVSNSFPGSVAPAAIAKTSLDDGMTGIPCSLPHAGAGSGQGVNQILSYVATRFGIGNLPSDCLIRLDH
jgi:hypothetical protein